ncbi:MAG TPA: serine hydrolase domain-containing protein [Burkholderiaceae bacterium]|nr:serine hydrolase domain-containing protein [Burkholderiaceae bacterium]
MAELDRILADAVAAEHVPFVVGMAGNAAGVLWSGAAGEARSGTPAQRDTVFRIFSMTKAVGSTAAMILIDRGKLSADTPVAQILPEFAQRQVLEGFNADGSPRMRPPRTQATVRHLATHTSGLVYEFWNTDVPRYMQATGLTSILSGSRSSLNYPLLFDPGTRWDYGIGIDWLGQVVEKVDGRTIDRFCREEIFEPLAMKDTRFEAEADIEPRLASVRMRGEDGHFSDFALAPPAKPEFYGMGHTLYSTAPDYMQFLRMVLNKGQLDGRRLLSEAGLQSMLANQIGNTPIPLLKTAVPAVTADAEFFPGRKKSHSLAFQRIEEDVPGMRSAGSQFWAGVCNTHFWFDPKKDVAGILMTQTLPFVEPRFVGVYEAFERGVYQALGR